MPNDWIGQSQGLCIDGVNSAVRPDLIGANQLAWMINGTVRDGKPRTRIGLVQRLILPSGKFQGVGYYSQGQGKLVFSIGGLLSRVLLMGNDFINENVPLSFPNASNLDEVWMCETPSGFIIQDDQSAAIIYNGSTTRRSDPTVPEIPIGSAMAFGNGRLWVVVKERRNLKAGDIYDGTLGAEWKFTETQYLLGGGAFYFPYNLTGVAFLPVNNTATGYGSLMVFGSRSLVSLRAEVTERDLWQIIPGFQTIVLDGIGTPSHHSITRVDQDLYFRDEEGQVRSIRSAAQEAQGPGNTGLSREISRIVDYETGSQLRLVSGVYVKNRLLFTAAPLLSIGLPQNVVFQKLVSLDCAPLATIRGKAPPAYDGEWTGCDILRVVQGSFRGQKRAFAVVRRGTENSLWEFVDGQRQDSYLDGGNPAKKVDIQSAVEFRGIDFNSPSSTKTLTRCDIYPSLIEGAVHVDVYWRVGNRNQWLLWGSFDACADMEDGTGSGGTNGVINPTNFLTADWILERVSIPTQRVLAPSNVLTAQAMEETATTGTHDISENGVPIFGGKQNYFSIYVQARGSRTKGVLEFNDGSGNICAATFDLIAGTIITGAGTGAITQPGSSIENIGEGWFKISVNAIFPDDALGRIQLFGTNAGGGFSYLGNPANGFNLWAPYAGLAPGIAHVWKNLTSQERGRVKSLTIPSIKDPILNLAQSSGFWFQVRLVWKGNVTIDRIDLWARPTPEKQYSDVFDLPDSCLQSTVKSNDLVYTIIP